MIHGLNNQLSNFLSRHTLGQRATHQFLQPLDRCWRAGRIHLCHDGFWATGLGTVCTAMGAVIKLVSARVVAIYSTTGASGASLITDATNRSDRGAG